VVKVTSGYAGGSKNNPNYWDVHSFGNDHAEVVRVEFDPQIINLTQILEIFWVMHDPTTKNQQGHDIGPEYRSIILYSDDDELKIIHDSIKKVAKKLWSRPLTTEIKQLDQFWPAEIEHQDYFNKHPEQAYCQIIINPKIAKFKQKFSELIVN